MPSAVIYGRNPVPADVFTGTELWSLVGGTDALADASDSTYVQAEQHWTGSGSSLAVTGPNTSVTMDSTAMTFMDTFTHLVLHLRFQQTLNSRAGVGPPTFQMSFINDVGFFGVNPLPMVDDLATHDYLFDWTPDSNEFQFGWPAGLFSNGDVHWHIGQTAALTTGPGSGDTQHHIYETWLEVEWTGPAPLCLQNAERSSCIHMKAPDGTWFDLSLVGS